jgi:hypothetical protein
MYGGDLAKAESKGSVLDATSLDEKAGPGGRHRVGTEMRTLVVACAVYGGMVLLFTLISLYTAPQDAQIGTFRPFQTIPSHVLILTSLGLGLGLTTSAVRRKLDLRIAILVPALVVLTDLDHLPAYLGLAQPIRPAHSVIFIICTVALMATVIRKAGVELISLSAFFVHLSADTSVFPPFSPVSFQYYGIGDFRIPALLSAVAFALVAGLAMKRNEQGVVV